MSPMDVLHGIPHFLWTTSWQAGVMAGATWLACRQWPRMPANLRVMLWWLVSLKFVIGLVWTQPIALPVLPASFAPAAGDDVVISLARPTEIGSNAIASDVIGSNTIGSNATIGSYALTGLTIVAACWLIGILVQGALLLHQLARTRRLVARSQPVEGDAVELFDDLVDRLEIRGSRPRLHVSTEIATPQVTGLVHPVVLLPVGTLESFTTRELTLTLCHELIHVQRFDLWHGWIPSIAARLFFFHPFARLAAREYTIAREAACDARVLAFTQAPAYDYGRLLMRLGVTAREAAPAAAGASPTLRTLKRRLLMLHDASPHARRLSPRWWVVAALAALLVIPMRPTAQPFSTEMRGADVATAAARVGADVAIAAARAGELMAQSADTRPSSSLHQHKDGPKKHQHEGEAWVFFQGDDVASMHGSSQELAEAKRQRANSSESLIWFKQDGRAYVIRDRQMLDKAHALFIPQHELRKAQRGLDERQTILGARQTALGKTQESLSEQVRAFDDKVKDANDALAKGVDRQIPSSEVPKLVAQMEASLHQAEATRGEIRKEQDALAIQQRVLGEHQAALGAEQEALGRQQEEIARATTWEIRTLFNNAIAAGLATPVK